MAQSAVIGTIPTDNGANFRADLNEVDLANATLHAGTSFPSVPVASQFCIRTDQLILYRRNENNTSWVVIENFGATGAPTTDDDTTLYYRRGSVWFGPTLSAVWVCVDNTDGAAQWADITASGSAAPGGNDGNLQFRNGSVFGGDPLITRISSGLLYARNIQLGFSANSGTGDWSPLPTYGFMNVSRAANFTISSVNFTPPTTVGAVHVTSVLIKNTLGSAISVSAYQGTASDQWTDVVGATSPFTVTSKRLITMIAARESSTVTHKQFHISADT